MFVDKMLIFFSYRKIQLRKINRGSFAWCADLSGEFAKDVQDFVKVMYNSGQAMVPGCRSAKESSNDQIFLNPSALLMQSIVSCIELLRWAIREESG